MGMDYNQRVKLNEDLIKRINLNIVDKCDYLNSKGKCTLGCWNCTISEALKEILKLHEPLEGSVVCKQKCDDLSDEFLCPTVLAINRADLL